MVFRTLVVATLIALAVGQAPSLKVEFDAPSPVRSLSRTPDGRTFFCFIQQGPGQRIDGSTGPFLVEYFQANGTTKAYPDEAWNDASQADSDPAHHIIGITSQRIGPDGHLWVLDGGQSHRGPQPAGSSPPASPAAKLIQIDLTSNSVTNVWDLSGFAKANSFLAEFRFNNDTVYLADVGAPAIVVLNLKTGKARRVLENSPWTKASFPKSAEGRIMRGPDNSPMYINVAHLEVSPDGKYLYFQPGSGGLRRIETGYLDGNGSGLGDDDDATLEGLVEPFALTVSTGGTAIDAAGNIYSSDTDFQRIVKISPSGQQTELMRDARLLDANMWVDSTGRKLFMAASQHNRAAFLNGGTSLVQPPFHVFSIDIDVGPSWLDHD